MVKKRTDRTKALDAINTLWNKYDETYDNLWRDAVNLMAHMLEFMPKHQFRFGKDGIMLKHLGFMSVTLNSRKKDPIVLVRNEGLVDSDFADLPVLLQHAAIAEVKEALFKGVEL